MTKGELINTRRLTALLAISVIVAACSATPRLDAEEPQVKPPAQQSGVTNPELGVATESRPGGPQSDSATPAELGTDTATSVGSGNAAADAIPESTTTTTGSEATGTTTTTTVQASTGDIVELLNDLDGLLSSIGDQLDGLDEDLADVASSLNENEGDIEG